LTLARILRITFGCCLLVAGCGGQNSSGPSGPDDGDALQYLYCQVVQVESEMHAQWAANRPTEGTIEWGRQGLEENLTVPILADSHDIRIPSIAFNTDYVFRITARDSAGTSIAQSGIFTTPAKATEAPIIFNLALSQINHESALATWETDEPASTILFYGMASPNDSLTNTAMTTLHEARLQSLLPSTSYWIRPEAVDVEGYRGVGRDTSFTTALQLVLWTPDTSITLGDTILLPIWLSNAQDIAALQFMLDFGTAHVQILELYEGPFYSTRDGFAFLRNVDAVHGRAQAHISWEIEVVGDERVGTNADGSGITALLQIRGLEPGIDEPAFSVGSSMGLDMMGTALSCSLRAGIVEILPE